jgi:N-acetyl-gamma-glutamyl-phosphate reductase
MVKVSIVGASGYSGAELIKILSGHPGVKIDRLFANTSAGKSMAEVFPFFKKTSDKILEQYSSGAVKGSDLVFIALPSGEAMNIVPGILTEGKKIVDLGGDFRLKDASLYEKYYKRNHTAPRELEQAVYGMPEWNREKIKTASLLSNPGCYPTSAVLPLLPLLKERLIRPEGIAINSLSGVSGAGKSASLEMSFAEVNESVRAYKVGVHQHLPEIRAVLADIGGDEVGLLFVPHLLPITRGIYTTTYATVARETDENEILAAFEKYYYGAPFVRFSGTAVPEIKNVNYTNFIDIGFRLDSESGRIIVLSAIDNLIKGAAGQAVQNMNIMFGFKETEGLL